MNKYRGRILISTNYFSLVRIYISIYPTYFFFLYTKIINSFFISCSISNFKQLAYIITNYTSFYRNYKFIILQNNHRHAQIYIYIINKLFLIKSFEYNDHIRERHSRNNDNNYAQTSLQSSTYIIISRNTQSNESNVQTNAASSLCRPSSPSTEYLGPEFDREFVHTHKMCITQSISICTLDQNIDGARGRGGKRARGG